MRELVGWVLLSPANQGETQPTHVRHTFSANTFSGNGRRGLAHPTDQWRWALRMAIEIRQQMDKGRVKRVAV